MRKLNKMKVRVGKERWREKGGECRIRRSASSMEECWGFLWVVGVCVPDVTVLFSWVNGDCEVVYTSDCEFVEPPTLSLSRKREAFFVEGQEDVSIDRAPVKAPSASRVTASMRREMVEQKAFRGRLWAAFGIGATRAQNVGASHHQKNSGPDLFWKM